MKKYTLEQVIRLVAGSVLLTADQYNRRSHLVSKPKNGVSKIIEPIMFKAHEEFGYDGEIPKSHLPPKQDEDAVALANQKEAEGLIKAIDAEVIRLGLEGDNVPDTSDASVEELTTLLDALKAASPVVSVKEPAEGSDERFDAIVAAIQTLDPDNRDQFTQGGKPDATVLTEHLGWQVSAAERDEAWTAIKEAD